MPVDVVAVFYRDERPEPCRFRFVASDENVCTVRVDMILAVEESRTLKSRIILYRCQSSVYGRERIYELRYFVDAARWELYKM